MKKLVLAYLAVFSMTIFSSCTKFMEEEDGYEKKTPHTAAQVASVGSPITSNMEVLSEELSYVTINNLNTNEVVDQFYVRRHHETIDLGSRETSEYGEWEIISSQIGDPVRVNTRAEGLFTITTYRVTVTSIVSNGEVEFNTSYDLEYEDWSWTNGDTTIVGNVHWDVENEIVVRNGSKVQDQLNLNFHEFKQTVSETGTLLLNNQAMESRFKSVKFSVTLDPDHANTWLVGCAVTMTDGTWALALEPDGTPVASRSKFWAGDVNASYNGAYYIKNKGMWYPAIASDQNDGMEWCVGGRKINIISYADADQYPNWGNGNKDIYGQNSVKLTGYSVKDNPESQTLTFFYNGIERGTLSYAEL